MKRTVQFLRGATLSQTGFTLIEALVVMGMTGVLLAISLVAIARPQAKNSVETVTTTFSSDLKQQQLLSMLGDSGTQTLAQAHGIRITATNYTVFTGSSFATSTNQFTITPGQSVVFSYTTLPLDIIFAKHSGETAAISNLIIKDNIGDQRTVGINRLGGVNVN